MIDASTKIKRAHIALMKHPETAMYSGIILMGKTTVEDGVPTAYTDGFNKVYGAEFISSLKDEHVRGIVLHETLHIALKHVHRFNKEFKKDALLINMATDFVVNDIINSLNDKTIAVLPEGALYDPFFHNWDTREVYNYLKKNSKPKPKPQNGDGGGGSGNDSNDGNSSNDGDVEVNVNGKKYVYKQLDEHDFGKLMEGMTPEQAKEFNEKVDRAMQEGGILAGTMGSKVPRSISDLLTPKVKWWEVLQEFVTNTMRGSDEYTWRKFNKRLMANDLYMPSMENETVGELIYAIDTSGSIGERELTEASTELANLCDLLNPSKVRVLWWDTEVHGEQVFTDNYTNLAKLLKPMGGGGTRVSCVSQYIKDNNIKAEAVIVFTDGYVEGNIEWDVSVPTLWVVTENRSFNPPVGKLVKYERKGEV